MRSVPALLCSLGALLLHGGLLLGASQARDREVRPARVTEPLVAVDLEIAAVHEEVASAAIDSAPASSAATHAGPVRAAASSAASASASSDAEFDAAASDADFDLAAASAPSASALGVASSVSLGTGLPTRLARLNGTGHDRARNTIALQEKRPARLTTGARACRDLLDPRYFEAEPAALVRVAVDSTGEAAFAGLERPHPAGAAFERVSRACVSRMHFSPARDERGDAMASTAVLRLSRPL